MIVQSIISLMKQPQTQAEAKPARREQMMMMNRLFGPRGFLTEEEQQIGQQIQERLRPQFDANLGNNRPFPQNVRQQLALCNYVFVRQLLY